MTETKEKIAEIGQQPAALHAAKTVGPSPAAGILETAKAPASGNAAKDSAAEAAAPAAPATLVKRGRPRKTNAKGGDTMEAVLESARRILVAEGPGKFTLERVAKEAGITKGALLYHFHDKDQLLAKLMEQYVERLRGRFEEGRRHALEKHLTGEDETTAAFAEWYRRFRREDIRESSLGLELLSMATHNDAMLKKINAWYGQVFGELTGDPKKRAALIAVLAIEGLFYLRHFRVDVLDDERIEAVLGDAIELTRRGAKDGD